MKLPAELKPKDVVAVIDTREQAPLSLSPLTVTAGTLTTGDYSIQGMENIVAIERKYLQDLVACVGRERERFDREVQRLLAYPVRALVVEANWDQIEMGQWRGQVKPNAVMGSLMGWIAMGLPVIMARDHRRAGEYVSRLLFIAARRKWRECRTLAAGIREEETADAT